MPTKKVILIAGATGFIGKSLVEELKKSHEVKILTRKKEKLNPEFFYWNPEKKEIDVQAFENVTHLINLCGVGIADKRWTRSRKRELLESRVVPTKFLFSQIHLMPNLQQYITASGINCYDTENQDKIYTENDELASDFISDLIKKWENAADAFQTKCNVLKWRISMVLSESGGGLAKIEKPIKMGFGSVLGSGKQPMPWIHLEDLVKLVSFGIENHLEGVYHAVADNTTNKEITHLLAKKNNKKIFLPNIPEFILKLFLGELSVLVLKGIKASNQKIINKGFSFKFKKITDCFQKTD